MSRKMTRNNYIPASAAPNPFPIDRPSGRGQKHQASGYRQSKHQSSGQGQSKRNQTQLDRPRNAFTDSDKANQNEGDETGRSSARSSSSDEDADAEVSNTDAVEADEEEDEDANGDALAPSGCAMNKHGNQAGRIKLVFKKGALLSRKRKASSAGLKSAAQTTKHVRSTSRNTTSHDEASDSDDEAYNAVDLVSEDESDVEEFEEKNITNAEDGKEDMPAFPDENTAETSDGWEGFDIDNNLILPDVPYFDEQYERIESGILGSEIEHFQLASLIDDLEGPTSLGLSSTRRVRFKDQMPPPSDSSDIVSNDEDLYGLFNTTEIPVQSSKNVTFDFDDVDDVYAGGNSSGYETDYGETTDEEITTMRPKSIHRRPSLSSAIDTPSNASAAPSPFKVPAAPAGYKPGPRMGSWKVDRTKPCAMIDSTGDNMVIIPAKRPARINTMFGQAGSTATSTTCPSPVTPRPTLPSALDDSEVGYNDFSSQVVKDPMFGSCPDVTSLARPPSVVSSRVQEQEFADACVFFPMDSMGNVSALYALDDQDDDDDDDDEALLNVEDFIDFGVDSSDSDDDDEEAKDEDAIARATLPTPLSTSPTVVPNQIPAKTPSPDSSSTNDLLEHFEKGVIGAFRRGQPNHQQRPRRPSRTEPSLNKQAFKGGRYSAANTQLGAQKKRKLSDSFSPRPSHAGVAKRKIR